MSADNRFRRLRLKNWKNFSSVDVDLQRRVFLVGPNASGKSNFLDVLRFLRDVASTGGGFQESISHRGGVGAIRISERATRACAGSVTRCESPCLNWRKSNSLATLAVLPTCVASTSTGGRKVRGRTRNSSRMGRFG